MDNILEPTEIVDVYKINKEILLAELVKPMNEDVNNMSIEDIKLSFEFVSRLFNGIIY